MSWDDLSSDWECACGISNDYYKEICGGCGCTREKSEEYKKVEKIETIISESPPVLELTATGKKICKACAEEIQPAALVCPHCRLNPDVDPRISAAAQSGIKEEKDISRSTILTWALIILALGSILKTCTKYSY